MPPTTRPSGTHRHVRMRLTTGGIVMAVMVGLALAVGAGGDPASVTTQVSADGSPRAAHGACARSHRGIPRCRPLVGAAHGSNTEPTALEAPAGRPLGVRRTYFTGDQVDYAVRTARADVAAGRVPWISFKLPMSWADMAAGRGDAWASDLARRLARVPGPVWLAFHHEPEGDGDLAAWRRMQEHLAPLVRSRAHNVAYTVILTGWNQLYGDDEFGLERIWPRGVKIDIAGFDVYNEFGVVKDGRYDDRWPGMRKTFYQPLSRWAAAHDVRWAVAETGYTDDAARAYAGYLRDTYRAVSKLDGVAFTYFDSPLNSVASWELNLRAKQRAFTALLGRSPRAG